MTVAELAKAILPDPEKTVGLNYSTAHFYTDSDGYQPDPPHWLGDLEQNWRKRSGNCSRKLFKIFLFLPVGTPVKAHEIRIQEMWIWPGFCRNICLARLKNGDAG